MVSSSLDFRGILTIAKQMASGTTMHLSIVLRPELTIYNGFTSAESSGTMMAARGATLAGYEHSILTPQPRLA
jgi:hypothetical protein